MWLKGTTTWEDLVDDLIKLAAGEITDGVGNTVPADDRWIRPVVGENFLQTRSALDVPLGNMNNRAGYFSSWRYRDLVGENDEVDPDLTVVRATNVYTSAPSGATKWVVWVAVNATNSVAGNYSTASIQYRVYLAESPYTLLVNNSVTPNAAGVVSPGNGFQFTVSDPSGRLREGIAGGQWVRQFNTDYMGGIDYFGPMYNRKTAPATFSVDPPGTETVDWDLVDYVTTGTPGSPFSESPRGGVGCGVGIKTNTGLTGAQYTCTWDAALQKFQLFAGVEDGTVDLYIAHDIIDDGSGTYLGRGGYFVDSWLRTHQTPGSVALTDEIQYWMSVKEDSIAIILNADPNHTGKLTCAMLGTLSNIKFPTYDKFPCFWSTTAKDFLSNYLDGGTFHMRQQFSLMNQKWRQDGSEGRDWQTTWMRADLNGGNGDGVEQSGYQHISTGGVTTGEVLYAIASPGYLYGFNNAESDTNAPFFPTRQQKPLIWDNKWWLYGFYFSDRFWGGGRANNTSGDDISQYYGDRIVRGDTTAHYYWISDGGWSSGDELTDTDTSEVYFLVAADYHGIGGRMRTGVNKFVGGVAILERD